MRCTITIHNLAVKEHSVASYTFGDFPMTQGHQVNTERVWCGNYESTLDALDELRQMNLGYLLRYTDGADEEQKEGNAG
jgi:hypothetical protein